MQGFYMYVVAQLYSHFQLINIEEELGGACREWGY